LNTNHLNYQAVLGCLRLQAIEALRQGKRGIMW